MSSSDQLDFCMENRLGPRDRIARMTHAEQIAFQLNVKPSQVTAVINLLDEGNTVPFIARYRKEMTGSLDDEQIRIIADELVRLRALDERRASILASIEEQGKLTDELRESINAALTLTALEDLYAPYKKKRRTRAMAAREKGLEPLAQLILQQPTTGSVETAAEKFLNDQVADVAEALQGGFCIQFGHRNTLAAKVRRKGQGWQANDTRIFHPFQAARHPLQNPK